MHSGLTEFEDLCWVSVFGNRREGGRLMVLNASLRFLGGMPPVLQHRQVARRWQRNSWIPQNRQRVAGAVALGKVDEAMGIEALDKKQRMQVSLFVDSLLDWNQRMNLTAVTEREAVMERHIMDSLALLPVVERAYSEHCCSDASNERLKVVDVGSGAGLPGLVLAIARPGWQVTLVESLQKRCNFLEYTVEKSQLSNVTVLRARAEESGQDGNHREVYDVAVARAVAEMRILSELCLPLVRLGGLFVAAKGPNPQEEVEASKNAISLLGASLLSVTTVASKGPLGHRTAIVCYKQNLTPGKYPRRSGTPGKCPL